MSKLTMLHINIIGAVVAIIVGLGLYFTLITGAQDTQKQAEAHLKGIQDRADKYDTAERNLKAAIKEKADSEKSYAVYERQYMPDMGYRATALETVIYDLWPNKGRSWPERYRRMFQTYMNQQNRKYGVVWQNPGVTAMGPFGPDPAKVDLGTGEGYGPVLHKAYDMQVSGKSLGSLLNHVRSWSNASGFGVPVVDSVSIQGNTPNLIMNYRLTVTNILKASNKIPAANARVTGENSSNGGGGGLGRGPGGPGGFGGPPPGFGGGSGGPGFSSGGGGGRGMMGTGSGGGFSSGGAPQPFTISGSGGVK